jgi:uncharacterized protein (DUF1800 family)
MLRKNWVLVLTGLAGLVAATTGGEFAKPLTADQKVMHALNRLAYGARPGDLEKVKQLGVDRWVEQQLHPESVAENPVLAERLKPLTTLGLTSEQVMRNYPPPQLMLVAARTGRTNEFGETAEQKAMLGAVMARYEALYEQGASKREAKKGISPQKPEMEMQDGNPLDPEAVRERLERGDLTKLNSLLTPDQAQVMTTGRPAEKAELLKSLDPAKFVDVVAVMPQNLRRQAGLAGGEELRRKMMYAVAPSSVVTQDLIENKIYRAVYSERQLEEVLTDFWFNHFNVFLNKGLTRAYVAGYERDAIRPHVLGNFRQLLGATAKHPAMLTYLDNAQSVDPNAAKQMEQRAGRYLRMARRMNDEQKERLQGLLKNRGLNENYARELMELHTLGVDGGYTQKDVTEVARALTGWGVANPRQGGGYGFRFNALLHDKGEKVVLGQELAAGRGIEDGEQVLDILANHPSTAKYISYRLAQKFVADEPPAKLVERMAATFTRTRGDLKEVMRTLLKSDEFWSQGAYRAKVKSPLEVVVSAVRVTGADLRSGTLVSQKIDQLGMPLYRKQEPTGYKNIGAEWVSSNALVERMNFALDLTKNRILGVRPTVALSSDPRAAAKELAGAELSVQSLQVIEKGLVEKAEAGMRREQLVAGLVLGSPEFQRH